MTMTTTNDHDDHDDDLGTDDDDDKFVLITVYPGNVMRFVAHPITNLT